ncbi:MAG TPA: ZIP family metal transporter [Solirubrobacteraceae bacterium]|nr:ZIP family metal transporter [Solirubrobacteraceae bacterium]
MGFAETVLLGAVAGFTIYLGLPIGRLGTVDDRLRVGLAMFSVGILAFIFMDVTKHGQEIVDTALGNFKNHKTSFADVLGLFALLAAGFTAGTAGISAIEHRLRPRAAVLPPIAGGSEAASIGAPPFAALGAALDARRHALQTGMTIAVAIGLHNFAEGLAIGVSAKAGAIGLATVLIIGFGLHNATEGFGIVGPLGGVRPSWKWLGLAGLVGGGPTFLGTIVGYQVHSDPLELCFYALAGGAILYVVGEIWIGMRRFGHRTLGLYLLAAGFLAGVATDLVVSYGGA